MLTTSIPRGLWLAPITAALSTALSAQGLRLEEEQSLVDVGDGNTGVDCLVDDLDGDGNLDWVIVGAGVADTAITLGLGDGRFVAAGSALPDSRGGTLGDFDGDGAADVLLATVSNGTELYLGAGTGAFSLLASSGLPDGSTLPYDVASADLEGDGDLDVIVSTLDGGSFPFLWNGSGFSADAMIPSGTATTQRFGDVDGDGDPDLFQGSFFAGVQDLVYRNAGGTLSIIPSATPEKSLFDLTHDASFGDCDGDGDLDLFIARDLTPGLYVNDGTGIYTEAVGALGADVLRGRSTLLADFDADGALDAFLGTRDDEPEYFGAGSGAGTFTPMVTDLADYVGEPEASVAGDVDGDGDLDLLLTGNNQPALVFLGDGALDLNTRTRRGRFAYLEESAAIGDLDGDGDTDVITTAHRVFLNDGAGDFPELLEAAPEGSATAIITGDVDGNGTLDALSFEDTILAPKDLLLNQGDGSFVASTRTLPPSNSGYVGGGFADMDNDGDLDALFCSPFVEYWFNDGAGGFTEAPAGFVPTPFYAGPFGLEDFDLDGTREAFATEGYYENDGAGILTIVESYAALPANVLFDFAVGDADGDLDPDVVIVHSQPAPQHDALWRFQGNGFTKEPLPGTPNGSRVVFADFDGDLDRDLLVETSDGFSSDELRLYTNDGAGVFTEAPDPFGGETVGGGGTTLTTVGNRYFGFDADADGDTDLLVLQRNALTSRLLMNRTRHVEQSTFAVPGKPLEVEINGPAGEPYVLALATATAAVPFAPFGLLQIDLGSTVGFFPGLFDGTGEALAPFVVPDLASLVGNSIYWQAAAGSALLLSNRDASEIIP